MSIPSKVLSHLTTSKVPHEVVTHKKVFTAYDLAQTMREKLQNIAKTLLVKVDKEYKIIVIPAHYRLDLGKLKKILKVKALRIAKEGEMAKRLKVKPGALSPFGTLYKVGVVVDASLLKVQKAIFQAGSFTESLRMKVKDFMELEHPIVGHFVTKPVPQKKRS